MIDYGKAGLNVSTVRRWVNWMNSKPREKGETDLCDSFCSGRSAASVNENKIKQAESLITVDKKSLLQNQKSWAEPFVVNSC